MHMHQSIRVGWWETKTRRSLHCVWIAARKSREKRSFGVECELMSNSLSRAGECRGSASGSARTRKLLRTKLLVLVLPGAACSHWLDAQRHCCARLAAAVRLREELDSVRQRVKFCVAAELPHKGRVSGEALVIMPWPLSETMRCELM